jgi:hypothetical protein
MIARTLSGLTLAMLVCAARFAHQLPPSPPLPAAAAQVESGSHRPLTVTIPKRPAPAAVLIYVSVNGFDNGDGSPSRPFKTLTRAQDYRALSLMRKTQYVAK